MKFIIRNWLPPELFESNSYRKTKRKFNKMIKNIGDEECDIQVYKILNEYSQKRYIDYLR